MASESADTAWVERRIAQAMAILHAPGPVATEESVDATAAFIVESDDAYTQEMGTPPPHSLFHSLLCAVMMASETRTSPPDVSEMTLEEAEAMEAVWQEKERELAALTGEGPEPEES